MNPILISAISLALMMLGIILGASIQQRLPEGHLSSDSKEVVKLSMGIMGTLAALVLGLLVASAHTSYAAREGEVRQLTAQVILLDTLLEQYGDGAQSVRVTLRRAVPQVAERIWREGQSTTLQTEPFEAAAEGEAFYRQIQQLQPSNESQRDIKERLLQVTTDTAQARFLLFSHLGSTIPIPFLTVLFFWLLVLFAGFAVLAHPNGTTLASLLICALSVSGAIFLILELDEPFSGLMTISSEPLRHALPPI